MNQQERLAATAAPLLDWYEKNKRDLPWRRTRDPYKIWVSEIMLQQTRVAAALPYYLRWMEELPDVNALAAVEEERLMKLWQGLGYYSRARNLQRAAKVIVEELDGRFPDTWEELRKLPGVGDYTAGAVASIAFGRRVPAVDGNVLRVAARVADIRENIMDTKVRRRLSELMAAAVPSDRPGTYNQALMDLGATVCLPNGKPLCDACPLSTLCEAHRLGLEEALPVREKKASRRVEELTVYLLVRDGRVALRKRPDRGLLAGLWEFPHVSGCLGEDAAGEPVVGWGLTPLEWRERLAARHIFTHVEWRMTGYLLTVSGPGPEEFFWADREALVGLAVPSAFGRFLEKIKEIL